MFDDQTDGDNPPYGASINYWLGSATEDSVKLTITDASGDVVRTLDGSQDEGINRVWWDLQGEQSTEIKLRTKPLYADWVEFNDERWRAFPGGRISLLSPPGRYTVTLSVDGQEYSQPLMVHKDPNSSGSEADIHAQTAVMEDIMNDANTAADMINRIEWLRRQVLDVQAVLEDQGDAGEIVAAAEELEARLIEVEEGLFQMKVSGTGQDQIRWPTKLMSRLGYLLNTVSIGDFAPTDQEGEVHVVLKERLRRIQSELRAVLESDLAEFNRLLQGRGMTNIISDRD